MVRAVHKKSFCFLVPSKDVELLQSVLPLQMRHHRLVLSIFDEVSPALVSSAKITSVIDFASPESLLDKTKRRSATFKKC